ncbi:MAG: N-acetylglucosamine-6-phosphate deacetylase [Spirochaetales bacterium]|nr:MAG: N-acetylglucosamine-6-phosphate deacetylase [Spirochaetales bacterium]
MASILLTNGRVLAETEPLSNGYVLIKDGRIVSLGPMTGDPGLSADRVVDVKGAYISPGFIDMHTHGIMDVDFMESGAEDIKRGFFEYARYGVTRILGSTLSNPIDSIVNQIKVIRRAKEESPAGDLLAGVHVEGPWLAARCRGGHALEYLKNPKRDDVDRILGEAGDLIKTVTYAPELPGSVWLTETLAARGVVPVLGHTEASYEHAEKAILAGARHVTHMYDTTLGYRENPEEALVMMPGMETAVLYYDEVSIELIGCPVHVPRPFFKFINKVKPRERRIIVTDSLVGTGMPEGTELTYKDGRRVYVAEGVLRMHDPDPAVEGNLTGSAVTINLALKRLCGYADLSVAEAVRWCSLNPATTLGLNMETGSIKIGKYADIAVFGEDFDVRMTLLKGNIIFEKKQEST